MEDWARRGDGNGVVANLARRVTAAKQTGGAARKLTIKPFKERPKLPADFDAAVRWAAAVAPDGWHVVKFQHEHRVGVADADRSTPVATLTDGLSPRSAGYSLFRWSGNGVAGAAVNLYSRRFLDELPQTILDHSFTMVDGWLETRCREGSLRCYSLECAFDPPAGLGPTSSDPQDYAVDLAGGFDEGFASLEAGKTMQRLVQLQETPRSGCKQREAW